MLATKIMDDEIQEIILRKVILRKELKPVEIYMGDPAKLIEPDWVAISHAVAKDRDSYNLLFFKFEGECLTWEQFETLEIALDQAKAIVGLNHSEWDRCEIEITNDDGSISWNDTNTFG